MVRGIELRIRQDAPQHEKRTDKRSSQGQFGLIAGRIKGSRWLYHTLRRSVCINVAICESLEACHACPTVNGHLRWSPVDCSSLGAIAGKVWNACLTRAPGGPIAATAAVFRLIPGLI